MQTLDRIPNYTLAQIKMVKIILFLGGSFFGSLLYLIFFENYFNKFFSLPSFGFGSFFIILAFKVKYYKALGFGNLFIGNERVSVFSIMEVNQYFQSKNIVFVKYSVKNKVRFALLIIPFSDRKSFIPSELKNDYENSFVSYVKYWKEITISDANNNHT